MMRKKTLITLILFLISVCSFQSLAANLKNNEIDEWENLISAIIHVESRGNSNAVSKDGSCVGVLQIKTVLVRDCNRILKLKKSKKRFIYSDRRNVKKSIEMFNIIQDFYNPKHDIETAIRLWNGGCGWRKHKNQTQSYYRKVMKNFNNLK